MDQLFEKLIRKQINGLLKVKSKRKRKDTEQNFLFGSQDITDVLSYSSLEESGSYLVLNEKYIRTLFISGYPYVATSGFLNSLINFNANVDISYHIEQIDPNVAIPKLTRKITEFESTRRALVRKGAIVGSELLDPLDSAIKLRDKILRGQEKLFQVSIYIALTADSLTELNKMTTVLTTILGAKLFYSKIAMFQQLDGLQSILPRGQNTLSQKRNLDSSSTALTFPFVSSELVHENGILYGINKLNNSLVILDRFSLQNSNSITFAQSGSGKSYTAKVEILRQLMQGTNVIVIDPEREYKQLCKSVKGTYIKLSTNSQEKINPFEFYVNKLQNKDEALPAHIQDLTEIVSLMLDGVTSDELAVIDKAIVQTYKEFGFTLSGKSKKKATFPLLKDLQRTLKKMRQKNLCARLEKFTKGSLSHVFDSQTNVKLTNRLIVFDIKDLSESLRQIMLVVLSSFVYNQVKHNPQRRLLVIDEGWLLLQHTESARFISGLTRRARKYHLGVSIISQQANDFLQNEHGRVIASQSSLRILMRQDSTTIQNVSKAFQLSEYEKKFLLTCEKGEAIIIADQNHVAVRIIASGKEHPLITTDPVMPSSQM